MKKHTFFLSLMPVLVFSVNTVYGQHGFTIQERQLDHYGVREGYRIDRHPRILADVNGDNRNDIVAFGNRGVYVSYSTGTDFTAPELEVREYGYDAGDWRVDRHPRFMADVNGDNRADIVGFAKNGVYVSFSTGDSFTAPNRLVDGYGTSTGWLVESHPRFMADVDGDRRADIVGFFDDGVHVSYSNGTSFTAPELEVAEYGTSTGWRVDRHPRFMADVNGDQRADIVGFFNDGVYVSFSTGTDFAPPARVLSNYGYESEGYRISRHPRMVADVNGDQRADIVAFGNRGVYVSYSYYSSFRGNYFTRPSLEVRDYGYEANDWRVRRNPRIMADVNGDKRVDIVGFNKSGVIVSYSYYSSSKGNYFTDPTLKLKEFGYNDGWRVTQHPRLLTDINGDNMADLVGFGHRGVVVSYSVISIVEIQKPLSEEKALPQDLPPSNILSQAARIEKQNPSEMEPSADNLLISPVPFRDRAEIKYVVKEAGLVNLSLYNFAGIKVAEIVNLSWQQVGTHTTTLDASNLPRGVYLIRMKANGKEVKVKKVMAEK